MVRPSWHCCYSSSVECGLGSTRAIDAAAAHWLAAAERVELSRFRSPDRRRSWAAGRIAAKRTLLQLGIVPQVDPTEITIVSRDHRGTGVAPSLVVAGQTQRRSLSISHTPRGVLVGVSMTETVRIGVDLVLQSENGPGFRRLWFSEQEQDLMRVHGGRCMSAVLWAAKESAFKACGEGEAFAPRELEIERRNGGLWTCRTNGRDMTRVCRIHWWHVDGQIAALAVRNESAGVIRYDPHDIPRLAAQFTSAANGQTTRQLATARHRDSTT
ncbi:MAG: 4'-phosphopantetheinyl transferase superfamily protein [Planctomycetaceae bacterium]